MVQRSDDGANPGARQRLRGWREEVRVDRDDDDATDAPSGRAGAGGAEAVLADDAAPTLKVAAVARRLGVAPATLRTWARRYDLGPSAHTAGAHRQYSLEDLDRLMVMRRMTLEGYSPAEAARVAVRTSGAAAPDAGRPGPAPPRAPEPEPGARSAPALRATSPSVRSLARAAMALQSGECARQLEASTAVSGVVETWTALVRPVLQALSDRVGAVAPGRSPSALLEAALMAALRGVADAEPAGGPRVLVVRPCAPAGGAAPGPGGGTGDLLAHVVAAALREEGADSSVLPGTHPAERVAAVGEQVDAAVVVVVADAAVGGEDVVETGMLVDPDGLRVVLAGRGWGAAAPAPVVADLGDVVAAVLA